MVIIVKVVLNKQIEYTKKNTAEVTQRDIIPTYVPQANMKALDVTGLDSEQQETLASLHSEYTAYYRQAANNIFTFEDWVLQTQGDGEVVDDLKWRTFVLENTEVI